MNMIKLLYSLSLMLVLVNTHKYILKVFNIMYINCMSKLFHSLSLMLILVKLLTVLRSQVLQIFFQINNFEFRRCSWTFYLSVNVVFVYTSNAQELLEHELNEFTRPYLSPGGGAPWSLEATRSRNSSRRCSIKILIGNYRL